MAVFVHLHCRDLPRMYLQLDQIKNKQNKSLLLHLQFFFLTRYLAPYLLLSASTYFKVMFLLSILNHDCIFRFHCMRSALLETLLQTLQPQVNTRYLVYRNLKYDSMHCELSQSILLLDITVKSVYRAHVKEKEILQFFRHLNCKCIPHLF